MPSHFLRRARSINGYVVQTGLALTVLALSIHSAFAADVIDAGSANASAAAGAYRPEEAAKGSAIAPTQASLTATKPQSIIRREFIEQSVAPTGEYSAIVNISPSLSGAS